jgi:hypothetical protein
MRNKCFLHRMEPATSRHTFDGQNIGAIMADGKRETGIDPPPVDNDGAGAALAAVTAFLGSGQMQAFAKEIEQRDTRIIEFDASRNAIDDQFDWKTHPVLHMSDWGTNSVHRRNSAALRTFPA